MNKGWYAHLLWVLAAAVLGFAVAAVFAGLLRLPRRLYLIAYVALAGALVYGFFRWSGADLVSLVRHNWLWGLVGAAIVGVAVVRNVLSQPASPTTHGAELIFDIFWLGAVYGALDGLLLSVLPVLGTWQAFSELGWTSTWPGKIAVGIAALAASLLVTAAYHLGYPEFQGPQVAGPVLGNGIMTVGYLLTNNPIAAVASHVAMHVAAVLHGPASTIQLPPHY